MRNGLLFVLLCGSLIARQSGIEGVAVDSVTRQPLAGVHVSMWEANFDGAQPRVSYGAISKADGHFSITGVKPDIYFLKAERNGYLYRTKNGHDGSNVTLKPGELTSFPLEMTAEAVVTGHVLDEFGDPVQNVAVVPEPAGSSEKTDERGEYRLVLPPGKYFFRAEIVKRPEIPGRGAAATIYADTYYPGSESKNRALPVELKPGQVVSGLDISLVQKRSLTIRGEVAGGNPVVQSFVNLIAHGVNGDEFRTAGGVLVNPDGKFTVNGLAPGLYRLRATQFSEGKELRSWPVEVQLDSSDENNVTLALRPGESVSGDVVFEGGTATPVSIRLNPDGKGVDVGPDGKFRIEEVFAGRYSVGVAPMPENGFIKSVEVDDRKSPDGMLDFSGGVNGARIKVTVSLNGGQVEGQVLGPDGEPLQSPLALVMLVSSANEIAEGNFKPIRAGSKYRYSGLAPGKYRVIAFDGRDFAGEPGDRAATFANGTEIEIREGDRITKDVKVVDAAVH